MYSGTQGDGATDIQPTRDGGYIFIGETTSNDGDVSNNHGNGDIWVVKLNKNGSIAWQSCYGGSSVEYSSGYTYGKGDIRETPDGYVFLGSTKSTDGQVTGMHKNPNPNLDWADIWAVKLNTTGTIVWQQCIGGIGNEEPSGLAITSDGGCLIAGNTSSLDGNVPAKHGAVGTDPFLMKLQANGTIQWSKAYGGSGDDGCSELAPTFDGGAIVAGTTSSSDGDVSFLHGTLSDAWVFKVNSTGALEWEKTFGGSRPEVFTHVLVKNEDELLLTGYTQSADGDGDVRGGRNAGAPASYSEVWILKTGNYNIIKGTVFIDYNANGIKDGNDVFMKKGIVTSTKPGYQTAGAVFDGKFILGVDTGTYTTSFQSSYYTKHNSIIVMAVIYNSLFDKCQSLSNYY